MDVSFINPFVKATVETFDTMLNIKLKTENPLLKQDAKHSYDVSGVIGLSGEAQGVISLSFPKIIALKVVSSLLSEEVTPLLKIF